MRRRTAPEPRYHRVTRSMLRAPKSNNDPSMLRAPKSTNDRPAAALQQPTAALKAAFQPEKTPLKEARQPETQLASQVPGSSHAPCGLLPSPPPPSYMSGVDAHATHFLCLLVLNTHYDPYTQARQKFACAHSAVVAGVPSLAPSGDSLLI